MDVFDRAHLRPGRLAAATPGAGPPPRAGPAPGRRRAGGRGAPPPAASPPPPPRSRRATADRRRRRPPVSARRRVLRAYSRPGRFSGTSANGSSAPRPSTSRLIRSQLRSTSRVLSASRFAEDVRVAADQLLGSCSATSPIEPAPRSSSSSARNTTWNSTSPSSSRSFASSPRCAASASSYASSTVCGTIERSSCSRSHGHSRRRRRVIRSSRSSASEPTRGRPRPQARPRSRRAQPPGGAGGAVCGAVPAAPSPAAAAGPSRRDRPGGTSPAAPSGAGPSRAAAGDQTRRQLPARRCGGARADRPLRLDRRRRRAEDALGARLEHAARRHGRVAARSS